MTKLIVTFANLPTRPKSYQIVTESRVKKLWRNDADWIQMAQDTVICKIS